MLGSLCSVTAGRKLLFTIILLYLVSRGIRRSHNYQRSDNYVQPSFWGQTFLLWCPLSLPPSRLHRFSANACIDVLAPRWKSMDDCSLTDFCHAASQHWEAAHSRWMMLAQQTQINVFCLAVSVPSESTLNSCLRLFDGLVHSTTLNDQKLVSYECKANGDCQISSCFASFGFFFFLQNKMNLTGNYCLLKERGLNLKIVLTSLTLLLSRYRPLCSVTFFSKTQNVLMCWWEQCSPEELAPAPQELISCHWKTLFVGRIPAERRCSFMESTKECERKVRFPA